MSFRRNHTIEGQSIPRLIGERRWLSIAGPSSPTVFFLGRMGVVWDGERLWLRIVDRRWTA